MKSVSPRKIRILCCRVAPTRYLKRSAEGLLGLAVIILAVGGVLSALSYHPSDPSPLRAGPGPVQNWLGATGAALADIGLQSFGYAWYLPMLVMVAWGWRFFDHKPIAQFWAKFSFMLLMLLMAAVAMGCFVPRAGGMIGVLALQQFHRMVPVLGGGGVAAIITLCAVTSVAAWVLSLGYSWQEWKVFGQFAGEKGKIAAIYSGRALAHGGHLSKKAAQNLSSKIGQGAPLWWDFGRNLAQKWRGKTAYAGATATSSSQANGAATENFATASAAERSVTEHPAHDFTVAPPTIEDFTPISEDPLTEAPHKEDLLTHELSGAENANFAATHGDDLFSHGMSEAAHAQFDAPSLTESLQPEEFSEVQTPEVTAQHSVLEQPQNNSGHLSGQFAQAPFTAAFASAARTGAPAVGTPYLAALRPKNPGTAQNIPQTQAEVSESPQIHARNGGQMAAESRTAPIGENFARSLSEVYQQQHRAPMPNDTDQEFEAQNLSGQNENDQNWHDTLPPSIEELADDSWQLPNHGPVEQSISHGQNLSRQNLSENPSQFATTTYGTASFANNFGADFSPAAQRANPSWQLPSLTYLTKRPASDDAEIDAEDHESIARQLENELANFNVFGDVVDYRPGPVVTLYEFEPAPGTKTAQVIKLADDLARSMSAIAVRIAVVPGRSVFGIELPNLRRRKVYLRDVLESEQWRQNEHKLPLALGKDIGGTPVLVDLAKMPHLLIAGTTGSGKSVGINTMILSLLYRLSPAQCRMIMIDPKMLELSVYEGIPHLLAPVVTDPKKAVVALKWAVREMEQRYNVMKELGVRDIDSYNRRIGELAASGATPTRQVVVGFDRHTGEKQMGERPIKLEPYPKIVIIVDELADLMIVAGKEIEGSIQRLAQMARAAGIHLVMATQRPSVDVITGTIKTNFPTRISFYLASTTDSRTILGVNGAEQLLGQGDMLYMMGGGRIKRVHGPFVSDSEVEEIVADLKAQSSPEFSQMLSFDSEDEEDEGASNAPAPRSGNMSSSRATGLEEDDDGDLYQRAIAVVARTGRATTSSIQRHLRIGYNRAATLIERMEDEGLIGPQLTPGGKREIMIPRQRGTSYDESLDE